MKTKPTNIMKKLSKYLFAFTVFLVSFSCCQNTDSSLVEPAISDPLEGVWQMTHYYATWGGDTVYSADTARYERVQHKIYLDGYVMWNTNPAEDSTEWHGFGTYHQSNDTVFEKLLTTSLPMMEIWKNWDDEEVALTVEYDEDNFKQTIASENNDTIYQQIEVYKKLQRNN